MSFWILAGGLTALAAGLTVAPLTANRRWLALSLVAGILSAALGLYLVLGQLK